jgi:hypothetical protein
MRTAPLVTALFDGPVDVIGDVHGEIGPLRALLARLGYDANGTHPAGRRAVFLGDLTDRGPDSVAVAELAMEWVARGRAQCVLGNHELNILRDDEKAGNAWILDPSRREQQPGGEFAHSRVATETFKARYLAFLAGLPIALERPDLRVVHAAWVPGEINVLRGEAASVLESYERYERAINAQLEMEGLRERADRERRAHHAALHHWAVKPALLTAVGEYDERHQMGNPVRAATSGVERMTSDPFWSSGKWRMCDRVRWWEEYTDNVPVIVGHYWRRLRPIPGSDHAGTKPDLFAGVGALDWLGPKRNVFCVDYSVGARYEERKAGKSAFDTCLAAVRWPEREVWSEQGLLNG